MPGLLAIPSTQRAVIANDKLNYTISDHAPMPVVAPDRVLIKTEALGLNPVDTKMIGPFVTAGASYGTDCAGTVVAVGEDIEAAGRIKVGDRVAGLADGMEGLRPQSGAFAEYVAVDGGMAFKMPESMSFAEGASMPLRIVTACMALFYSLELPAELLEKPTHDPFPVLVYGGATSTGTLAIQLLKRCGLVVLTTCSKASTALVESFGADKCFDYNDPGCGAAIREHSGNALDYVLDCITTESSAQICYQALGRCGGKYVGLEPLPESTNKRKAVVPDWILVSWLTGQKISWPAPFGTDGMPEAKAFAERFFPFIHALFTDGWFKAHPIREEPGGLEGLLDGVMLLRQGKIRGQKLVYRIADRKAHIKQEVV
ncbi:hypothetical protein DOTSEDRAFT_65424 [Dothistroma septosporum NZE10]|uniref:Enoyl reductase (ER) domain-containing protein n=1 Tax=Dothistroma septosporum (strain NZE10 / CBS 128990) TaxID=675120 RepID=N1PGX0_DOTSN|nr:hypothetical protein DOTSEDRAFT_65424 [Dothistroma septosporum NZE10]